jgi:hypothetical protein
MPTLHAEYITILGAFARLFSKRIWEHIALQKSFRIKQKFEKAKEFRKTQIQCSGVGFPCASRRSVWQHLSVVKVFVCEFSPIFANLKTIRADLRRFADYFLPEKLYR